MDMFGKEYKTMAAAAAGKVKMGKENPVGYFLLSMLAGAFIGFGMLLAFSISGYLEGALYAKIIMGAAFGAALSLVVMAGAELFTGNNLVLAAGCFQKTISPGDAIRLWIFCWLGNLAGSVLLAVIYYMTGLDSGVVADAIAAGAQAKMTASALALFTRGILCNILVCLAVWCTFKCKSESGKLIMIFWCILAFFTTGFEHSVANMTLLSVALIHPASQIITWSGWIYNLAIVTLGNMVGGIVFVSLPYFIISRNSV